MIDWNSSYETGHAQIDREHRHLIDKLNELERALLGGKAKDQLEPMLDFLETYAKEHFANEEACFRRIACPHAQENAQAHRQFIKEFASARERLREKGATTSLVIETHRKVCDFIAGMTDRYAMGLYEHLFFPKPWSVR